jgi:hypothetical protein
VRMMMMKRGVWMSRSALHDRLQKTTDELAMISCLNAYGR